MPRKQSQKKSWGIGSIVAKVLLVLLATDSAYHRLGGNWTMSNCDVVPLITQSSTQSITSTTQNAAETVPRRTTSSSNSAFGSCLEVRGQESPPSGAGQVAQIPFSSGTHEQSAFQYAYHMAFERASATPTLLATSTTATTTRRTFDLTTWTNDGCTEKGGLVDTDRQLLGRLYHDATSVMEFGLGESSYIAAAVDVPRYLGIDSDAVWVAQARDKSPHHFQFLSGDIGPTREWGFPTHPRLRKSMLLYELMPLWSQKEAFDVYFIDGRWRPACVLLSFLHASDRGRGGGEDEADKSKSVMVGIHDYFERQQYHRLEELLVKVESASRACFFRRKPTTTDEDILELYLYYDRICRRDLPAEIEEDIDAQRDLGC